MHMVLSGLLFAGYYMDDILVGGRSNAEITKNLIAVFERLAKYNLKIQLSKINFYKSEIKILGIIFSKSGKKIDPERVSAISAFLPITTLKECQKFLGTVNYVSSFIPHYATCMYLVYNLLERQIRRLLK